MHTKHPGVLASLVAAVVALSGCATIFTGTTDTLTFTANTPGVRLSIDGQYMGDLPITVTLSRSFVGGRQFVARFERAGFVTQEFPLHREFNVVAILDVTSIPTSGGIDLLTGSLIRLSPTEYRVQMLRHGATASSDEFRRGVALVRFALANWRSVQKDIARGGGEHLSSLATALCGDDPGAAFLVSYESVRNARLLLAASTGWDFVEQLEAVLATHPALRSYRL